MPPVPGTDLDRYLERIVERFSNPTIGDAVTRLCLDGSNRRSKFVEPTIAVLLNRDMLVEGIALISAFWCSYCYGFDESGNAYDIPDEAAGELQLLAREAQDEPLIFLRFQKALSVVGEDQRFREAFSANLSVIWSIGTARVLQDFISAP